MSFSFGFTDVGTWVPSFGFYRGRHLGPHKKFGLKVLAFTTVPSAVPSRLSLVLKHGPKYTPLCH
eukprot:2605193-Amphidinium_carterae.1